MQKTIKWNIPKIKSLVNVSKSRSEFKRKYPQAYDATVRLGLMNNLFSKHANQGYSTIRKRSGSITKKSISLIASKYKTRIDFYKNHRSEYSIAVQNGWLDDLFLKHANHGYSKAKMGTWQKQENVIKAASQCEDRTEFMTKFRGAYASSKENGWFEIATKNMEVKHNSHKRIVYLIASESIKLAYIGITYNLKQRIDAHKATGTNAVKALIKNGAVISIIDGPFVAKKAPSRERFFIEKYKKGGWTLVNKAPAGGMGGTKTKYSVEVLKKACALVKTRSEFQKRYNGHSQAAYKLGLMDMLFKNHTNNGRLSKPSGYWTFERVKGLAKKSKTRGDFNKKYPVASSIAHQKKWTNNLFENHPNKGLVKKCFRNMTVADFRKLSVLYKTRTAFSEGDPKSYSAAQSRGFLNVIFEKHPNRGFKHSPRNVIRHRGQHLGHFP